MDNVNGHAIGEPSGSQILSEMEQLFKPIIPSPTDSLATLYYRGGQASVTEWLRSRLTQED